MRPPHGIPHGPEADIAWKVTFGGRRLTGGKPKGEYRLDDGWYLTSRPLITANWEADSDNTWTAPIGAGIGKIFRIGKQPMNTMLEAYYNVETPDDFGADWQLRFSLQFLFPK